MWRYVIAVLVVLIAAAIVWYIRTYNKIKSTQVKIEETLSGIDVALTKRYDMLSKLLDITKAYAQHEKFTLIETIRMRSGMSVKECSEVNSKLDEIAKSIRVTAEAYPELRAMYDPEDNNTEVLYFKNAKATFSSFTAAPETVEF